MRIVIVTTTESCNRGGSCLAPRPSVWNPRLLWCLQNAGGL